MLEGTLSTFSFMSDPISFIQNVSLPPTQLLFPFFLAVLIWRLSRAKNSPSALETGSLKPPQSPPQEPLPSSVNSQSYSDHYQPQMGSVLNRPQPATALPHIVSKQASHWTAQIEAARVKQPYDAFLVLDVEATCLPGVGFDWPNEIIEWPVCLLRWKDKTSKGMASRLEIVDEFRSFVKPTWRPQLSQFCTDLTGITQGQVNHAPTFPQVLKLFARFLAQHGLIDPKNGRPLQRFCWCTDGPFDVRDFVVKQCFISKIPMPSWLRGDILDVRRVISVWLTMIDAQQVRTKLAASHHLRSLNIPQQLRTLGIGPFQGRQHCGMDDARNIARVIIELARRGIRLEPNTTINPHRRWQWMGRPGEVLDYYLI